MVTIPPRDEEEEKEEGSKVERGEVEGEGGARDFYKGEVGGGRLQGVTWGSAFPGVLFCFCLSCISFFAFLSLGRE